MHAPVRSCARLLRAGGFCLALFACKEPAKHDANAAPSASAPPITRPPNAPTEAPPWARDDADVAAFPAPHATIDRDAAEPTGPITITSSSTQAVAVAAAPDPFDAHLDAVRVAGVGCFAGMPEGEYRAVLSGRVSSGGTVVASEVTGVDDDGIKSCLKGALERHTFPSTSLGREVSVTVAASVRRKGT